MKAGCCQSVRSGLIAGLRLSPRNSEGHGFSSEATCALPPYGRLFEQMSVLQLTLTTNEVRPAIRRDVGGHTYERAG